MKITINVKNFVKELRLLEKFLDLKADGINGCILINATDEEKIILEAVNKYINIRLVSKSITIIEAGTAVINFSNLKAILKSANTKEAALENNLMKFGDYGVSLEMLSSSDFPSFNECSESMELYKMPAQKLAAMLSEALTAEDKKDKFPAYISYVLLRSEKGKIITAATDGHRLPISKYICENIRADKDLFLKMSNIKPCIGFLSSCKGNVKVCSDDTFTWFVLDNAEIAISMPEPIQFPIYERLLRHDFEVSMKIQSKLFEEIIKRAYTVVKNTPSHITVFRFTKGSQYVKVGAFSKKTDETRKIVFATEVTGSDLILGFNGQHLLDVVKALGSCEILAEFSGETEQARFYRANDKESLEYIIMPCHLNADERGVVNSD